MSDTSILSPHSTTAAPLARASRLSAAGLLTFAAALAATEIIVDASRFTIRTRVCLGSLAVIGVSWASIALALSPRERAERNNVAFGVLFPIFTGFAYGLLAFRWLSPPDPLDFVESQEAVIRTFRVIVIGMMAWTLGYRAMSLTAFARIPLRIAAKIMPVSPPGNRTFRVGVVLFGVGLAASTLTFARTGLGYLADPEQLAAGTTVVDGIASVLAGLGPLGIGLIAFDYFRKPRLGVALALAGAVLTESMLAIFSGGKQPFLVVIASIGLVGVAVGRIRAVTVALCVGVAILVIFPFNSRYRSLLRPSEGQQASQSEALSLLPQAAAETLVLAGSPSAYLDEAVGRSAGRTREIDATTIIMQAHDAARVEYVGLGGLPDRAAALAVPRVIWPAKPIDLFAAEITDVYYREGLQSASAVTLFGDGYRYQGLVGVVVGLFLAGVLVRFVDLGFDHRSNPFSLVIFLGLAPDIVKAESDLASYLVGSVRAVLVFSLALGLAQLVTRRTSIRRST